MLQNLHFTYDGVTSTSMGVTNVNLNSSLFEESFLPQRNIREEIIRGNEKPYFMGVDHSPFSFPLTLYFENLNANQRRTVAKWLMKDYYKPLIFDSNPDRIFYCMFSGSPSMIHNGIEQGYLELTMRCDSPYSYTPVQTTSLYDLSANPSGGTTIQFDNTGDDVCKPFITLEKTDDTETDIRIVNTSDNNKEMKFTVAKKATGTLSFAGNNIADPTTAPTLSQVANANSTLTAATYYVQYTWKNSAGETLGSTEANLTTSSGYELHVSVPVFPTGVTSAGIYVSTSTGTEKYQGDITTSGSDYVLTADPTTTGSTVPTTNTTGAVTYGETVSIGGDTYEFDDGTGVTTGNIAVDITTDTSADNAITQLTNVINTSTSVTEDVAASGDTTNDVVTVTYNQVGVQGNISVSETLANGSWSGTTLSGGVDGVISGEILEIDCENEDIETNAGVFDYTYFNNNYLSLLEGVNNQLQVYGNCTIKFKYEFKLFQG